MKRLNFLCPERKKARAKYNFCSYMNAGIKPKIIQECLTQLEKDASDYSINTR